MSHIIQLRQRIKTVELIQKTTHAMRLTSMSTHTRLHKRQSLLTRYSKELETISTLVKEDCAHFVPQFQQPREPRHLTIVIGAQKGLCGAFNIRLFRFFEQENAHTSPGSTIAIGKKIIEQLSPKYPLHYSFPLFSASNFFAISKELCEHIFGQTGYTQVTIFSSYPQSFFIQQPIKTVIEVPAPYDDTVAPEFDARSTSSERIYDNSAPSIQAFLEHSFIKIRLEELLFNSLIAEHAARFVSMDSSSNNAQKVLETMYRDYNKLRQASITRELIDLMSGLA